VTPKQAVEVIWAFGHPNISAIHPTTLMITKDKHVLQNGDCIVAAGADKAAPDLSPQFKEALRQPNAKLTIILEASGESAQINASGAPNLLLSHPKDMVVRKSEFISDRTIGVRSDKAASGVPRPLIKKMQNLKQQVKITLIVQA
jgi:uncharacterized protein